MDIIHIADSSAGAYPPPQEVLVSCAAAATQVPTGHSGCLPGTCYAKGPRTAKRDLGAGDRDGAGVGPVEVEFLSLFLGHSWAPYPPGLFPASLLVFSAIVPKATCCLPAPTCHPVSQCPETQPETRPPPCHSPRTSPSPGASPPCATSEHESSSSKVMGRNPSWICMEEEERQAQ